MMIQVKDNLDCNYQGTSNWAAGWKEGVTRAGKNGGG